MKVEPIIRTPEEWFREKMEERRESRKKERVVRTTLFCKIVKKFLQRESGKTRD